jgi:transposase
MGRKREKLDIQNQSKEVLNRLKKEPAGIVRERLLAVSLGLKGDLSLKEIAGRMGRSRATIQTWFDNYRAGGIEGLLPSDAPRGFPGALHEKARKELQKKLAKGSFRRVEDARVWLEKMHRVSLSQSRVGALLGKLGARLKVVRPRHPNSCDLKRECFRTQLARQMLSALKEQHPGKVLKDRRLRIWIADEARFGLQPCVKRAWVSRGVRACKSSKISYQWRYIWGALEVDGSGSSFLFSEGADTEFSLGFLEQIARKDPDSEHIVIWDGAGFHPNGGHEDIPENVTVLKQPPYSPELNCVEKLWDTLRDALCNRSWHSIDHLIEQATRWLRQFWESPERIRSLVGEGWILQQANG